MFDEYEVEDVIEVDVPAKKRGRRKRDSQVEESYFVKLKRDNQQRKRNNEEPLKKKKPAKHYINDAEFKVLMLEYHKLKTENPNCKVPDNLWNAFMLLANNIIRLPYFNKRLDKEDMIMNAVIKCIEKVDSFDISRESPFAYFTTIVRNSFWFSRKEANKMYYGDRQCYVEGVLDAFSTNDLDDDFESIQQDAMYYE